MTSTHEAGLPPYADASTPVAQRVDDLLARMTREEKLAQLGSAWAFELLREGEFAPDRAGELLGHGLGQVTRISGATNAGAREAAGLANRIQRHLVEETRLGIPAIVHEENCSGLMARESTMFPQAIGVASTWDPGLNERIAGVIREQMRAVGAHQGLSPVLDVCRDARWGRLEETYGEDPHLVARMGVAFVRGLQEGSPGAGDQRAHTGEGVVATGKHFVGYGASEGGMNWAPAHIPARELREIHLHPFEAAVREGGLRSIMNAYHELDGIPCGASRELLTDVLRGQWGFDGTVVADYFSVDQLAHYHRLAADKSEAAAMALRAGIDVELPSTDCYATPLAEALDRHRVDAAHVDAAVARVLRQKFELGLFERPYVDVDAAPTAMNAAPHQSLALETARRSLVLLKNDGDLLPLPDTHRTVAVIGPNADAARHLLGDYTYPAHIETLLETREDGAFGVTLPDDHQVEASVGDVPTVLDELRARLGERVRHARGCDVNTSDTSGIAEAAALAAQSDVVVLVVGDKSGLTDGCTSGEARDRASLDLPGAQEALAREVVATGTPVVVVLVAGRPCGSPWLHEQCAAVLMAWLPGQAGGRAIAETLTGAVNPSGKLPVSYPETVGQVPVFYNHKVSGGRSHWKGDYVDAPSRPRYPFGHGLTYTSFVVEATRIAEATLPTDGTATIEVTVANRGALAGEDVVQLYVRDPAASVTRPVRELKAFARVEAAPGETRRIAFGLPGALLGFHGEDLGYVVEPGEVEVSVGLSSADRVPAGTLTLVAGEEAEPAKVFAGTVTLD
ncbi:beta-glucosidase [Egibacter rhizosphaerae]|uniref:Exo-alpha-(1->6)-L-arabinopyranosidase n=1 Tax=Egibacter rhizosphaerae TaxID=1670831 RepID=A0A411YH06_9ACTN|nr:glycoside hydrolase family 3 N-terminal domain-containing protein [Egibacter rhizosphaerae]QBI20615.1 beta-glucosidase [Egibacter rhizosphaerae]